MEVDSDVSPHSDDKLSVGLVLTHCFGLFLWEEKLPTSKDNLINDFIEHRHQYEKPILLK